MSTEEEEENELSSGAKNREKTLLLRKIQQGLLLSASVAFQSKRILGMNFSRKLRGLPKNLTQELGKFLRG